MSSQGELEELEIEIRRTQLQRERLALERETAQRSRSTNVARAVMSSAEKVSGGAMAGVGVARGLVGAVLPLFVTLLILIVLFGISVVGLATIDPMDVRYTWQFRAGVYFLGGLAVAPVLYWALTETPVRIPRTSTLIKVVLVICIPFGVLSIAGQGHFSEDRDSYAAFLAEIDRNYPALNPRSPRYNAALDDRVARRLNQLRSSGMSQSQALRQAFGEVCSPQTGGRICQ